MKKTYRFSMMAMVAILIVVAAACSGGGNDNASTDEPEPAAASQPSNEAAAEPSEPSEPEKPLYVIQVFASPDQAAIVKRSDETPVFQVIKEKFNIVFELVPFSGDNINKLNTMLAAGDYPELVRLEGQATTDKYIAAGALVSLDGYMENAPNFQRILKDSIPFWRLAGKGELYYWAAGVPMDETGVLNTADIYVRSDILEEAGWPEIVSTDDYVKLLGDAIKKHPKTNNMDTIGLVAPFAESYGLLGISTAMTEKGGKWIKVSSRYALWNVVDEQFDDMFSNIYMYEGYKFFNQLHRVGAFDIESFTDKAAQVQEKMNSGRALASWYASWFKDPANLALRESGNDQLQYVSMPMRSPQQIEDGYKRITLAAETRPFENAAITINAKDPDRIFELLEWSASDEGQLLLQSGIEGRHYTIENGKRVPTEEFKQGLKTDPNYRIKEGLDLVQHLLVRANVSSPTDGQNYSLTMLPSVQDEVLSDREKQAYAAMGWESSKQYWLENGTVERVGLASGIGIDPNTPLGQLEQRLTDFRVKNTPRLITAAKSDEEFDQIYDQVMKEYWQLDPDKTVIQEYNNLYQEGKATLESLN